MRPAASMPRRCSRCPDAMIGWFENLPLIPAAVVVIGGFVALAIVFSRLAGRFIPVELLREHNELTGFIFAVVGVVYAVILGFVAVGVWERFVAAEDRTYDEASNLIAIYRDAGEFGNGARIRREARAYIENIVHLGWPVLEYGKGSLETTGGAETLARDVEHTQPRDAREEALYPTMIAALDEAMLDRDARVAEDANGLNGIMWVVVYAGGIITVAFTFLFGFRQTAMQTAMVGTLALLIGLVIFLMLSLDYPFRGTIRVGPEAFEHAAHLFDRIDAIDPVAGSQTR